MCGIFAIFTKTSLSDDLRENMDDTLSELSNRGPDSSAWVTPSEKALLGSTRLRIIGEDVEGRMPMSSAHTDVWIAFNGEIYNHRDLRRQLESRGHRFRSATDTEVLLNAYLEWGTDCVHRLNGMFAFVIFDSRSGLVHAARDRFGTKPLYYAVEPDWTGFASEFGVLRKFVSPRRRRLSEKAIASVVALRYVPWKETVDSRIRKLEPGELISFHVNSLEIRRKRFYRPLPFSTLKYNQEEFDDLLFQAIKITTNSDIGKSVLLSGGLDSSSVVSILKSTERDSIRTFSCSFGSNKNSTNRDPHKITSGFYDESAEARLVAELFGTDHTHFDLPAEVARESFFDLIDCLGEPIATPNALGLHLLAKQMKGQTKVANSGTGADEILGGYQGLYFGDSKSLSNRSPIEFLRATMDFDKGDFDPIALLRSDLRSLGHLSSLAETALLSHRNSNEEVLNQIASFELAFSLPYWELDQADRIFMSQSIELRPSFLENRFVDYCLSIPSGQKREKEPLKQAMRKKLPETILRRKKVASLSTPDGLARSNWFAEIVDDLMNSKNDLWDQNNLREFLSQADQKRSFDLLHRVVMLHAWLEQHAYVSSYVNPTKGS